MADNKRDKDYKRPVPENFIPTEMGSAIQVDVKGRPADKEYLIDDNDTEKITGSPGERQPE